ncbi:MAG: response regulator [Bacillota bacterium]|nr:MAG: two-component system response regulator [Bacillota bacterium]
MARVLIADDSVLVRMRLARLVQDFGHHVIMAEDGVQAVLKYETTRPDLVFMDVAMPVKDGITATREILYRYPDATIVAITGLGYDDVVKEVLVAGAKHVIAKPLEDHTIIEVLERFLCRQTL